MPRRSLDPALFSVPPASEAYRKVESTNMKKEGPSNTTTNPSDDSTNHEPGDLVVVGASAGGVGALTVLVSNLGDDFPAPVVIAQHLDPKRPSNLGSIL